MDKNILQHIIFVVPQKKSPGLEGHEVSEWWQNLNFGVNCPFKLNYFMECSIIFICNYWESFCSSWSILWAPKPVCCRFLSCFQKTNLVSVSCLKSCHYSPANLLRRLLWWLGVLNYVISIAMSGPAVLGWKKHLTNWGMPQSFIKEKENQADSLHCIATKYYFLACIHSLIMWKPLCSFWFWVIQYHVI